jgi:hypothetical protein
MLKIVNLYLFSLSSNYILFCSAVCKTDPINEDTEYLTTPNIREKNDQHLAQILHTFQNGSSAEKVN